ncbi:unnamed protein product, partial [Didymodactylos carnosus]
MRSWRSAMVRIVTYNMYGNAHKVTTQSWNRILLTQDEQRQPDIIAIGCQEVAMFKFYKSKNFQRRMTEYMAKRGYKKLYHAHVGGNFGLFSELTSKFYKPIQLLIYVLHSSQNRVQLIDENKVRRTFVDKRYKGIMAGRIQIDGSINILLVSGHFPAKEDRVVERCN